MTAEISNKNDTGAVMVKEEDSDKQKFQPIVYSQEDLEAMREVQRILVDEHNVDASKIGPRALALTTIINKHRVAEAVKGYLKLLEAIALVELDGITEDISSQVEPFLGRSYEPCGVDDQGRRVMWIRGKEPPHPDDEQAFTQASVLYWMAIHADNVSLREGVHFVLDVSNKNRDDPHGNDQKMRTISQSYPLRPQAILIAGTNAASRIFINAAIKMASLFVKAKTLQRIKFVTVEEAKESVPQDSSPQYVGGGGGGIDNIIDWVKDRLSKFPIPDLDNTIYC